jgi:Rrf2 family protein
MPHERVMLSSKAKYALRAIACLAQNASSGVWLQTGEVAEQEQVPHKFLEAIFVQLRDHGIIESRRGAQGGYRMLRDPAAVSVADIMRIVDGPLALTPCASRIGRYDFSLPDTVMNGGLRPLRNPTSAWDF